MHYIIGIRKALVWVYRSSWMFWLALNIGCGGVDCAGNQHENKKNPLSVEQTPLAPLIPLEVSNRLEPCNTVQRVAKVQEGQQGIALLHGLARGSYDFRAMSAALAQHFPKATIVALNSVEKDSRNTEKSSSLTAQLSTKEQARLAYEEIKKKFANGSHIVIVGHSQGGLRAVALVKEYEECLKRENQIVITELITIGTPWRGAPVFGYIQDPKRFNQQFNKIEPYLNAIKQGYGNAVRGYFVKKAPEFAKKHPSWYKLGARFLMKWRNLMGVVDLDPQSDFIRDYIPPALKVMKVPITAIAGVLTDFSKLFEPFPTSIEAHTLAQLNATYAELIGGHSDAEHDMLLPVATQHAKGLVTKDFKRIKIYGACHGNKVGVKVKDGLAELNNKAVIEQVAACIKKAFGAQKENSLLEVGERVPTAG